MSKTVKNKKAEVEAKIKHQTIIGEVNKGGYQPIRFTRIKYKAANDTILISGNINVLQAAMMKVKKIISFIRQNIGLQGSKNSKAY